MGQISRRQVLFGILGGFGALLGLRAGARAQAPPAPPVVPARVELPVPVTESWGSTTTYVYDGSERLVSIQEGAGTVLTYTYDGSGRVLHGPLNGTITYGYDPNKRRRP